jgi:hypothetical protein
LWVHSRLAAGLAQVRDIAFRDLENFIIHDDVSVSMTGSEGATFHIYSGHLTHNTLLRIAETLCHEAVQAAGEIHNHGPTFDVALQACVADSSW